MIRLCALMCCCLCSLLLGSSAGSANGAERRVSTRALELQVRAGVPISGVVLYPPVSERRQVRSLDDVGANVRCNQDPFGSRQNEMTAAASPLNPGIVLTGANDYRNGDASGGFYRTVDGGLTFTDALVTRGPVGSYDAAGDPVASADLSGRLYALYIAFDRDPGVDNGIYSQTSVDSGATWAAPVPVLEHVGGGTPDFEDKPYACSDYSVGSPYLDNYYVTWTKFRATGGSVIYFARSTTGGASFSTPVQISGGTSTQFSCPTVGPNGEIYAVWNSYSTNTIKLDYSLDGGDTWHLDHTIANFNNAFPTPGCGTWRVEGYPVVGCDISDGPRRGWLYCSWVDCSSGNPDVLFISSQDGGTNWTPPVHVEDDITGHWQWFHWMSVNPATGDIGIAWLDTRDDPANCTYKAYGSISTDGGVTWEPNFPISDAVSDPTTSTFLGDYNGTTFSADGFYACWVDLRNDTGDSYANWFRITPPPMMPPPTALVIHPENEFVRLIWNSENQPLYKVYSSVNPETPFETFEGSTTDTTYLDSTGIVPGIPRFYIVTSATE
ncbi:exo-alpha-sialidase [candidate division KSB1 bacterium]|nr:exo-alpha-sialidase [candidate division KSB1 bacterium]